MRLHLVSDGRFRLDGGMLFGVVPRVLWEKHFPPDPQNRITLGLNCLLVTAGSEVALVETGLGSNLDQRQRDLVWGVLPGEEGLLAGLRELGLAPEDVTAVVNTHLHADHSGGDTLLSEGKLVPTFPRARYFVQRREWEDAHRLNERTRATYYPDLLAPLRDSRRLELLDGETRILPFLTCLPTPGHTPGHQSVLVSDGELSALFLGDVAPFGVHFERLAWIPAIDLLPLETLESKRGVLAKVRRENPLLLFYHEEHLASARLREENGVPRLQAHPLP